MRGALAFVHGNVEILTFGLVFSKIAELFYSSQRAECADNVYILTMEGKSPELDHKRYI
jgi:hypothetical protein